MLSPSNVRRHFSLRLRSPTSHMREMWPGWPGHVIDGLVGKYINVSLRYDPPREDSSGHGYYFIDSEQGRWLFNTAWFEIAPNEVIVEPEVLDAHEM